MSEAITGVRQSSNKVTSGDSPILHSCTPMPIMPFAEVSGATVAVHVANCMHHRTVSGDEMGQRSHHISPEATCMCGVLSDPLGGPPMHQNSTLV